MMISPSRIELAFSVHRRPRAEAFTLVELLVTISIIALLVSITLPALAKARAAGRQTRELSAGNQLLKAYLTYAQDNRDKVLPGYLRSAWTDPSMDPAHEFKVWDNDKTADEDERMFGTTIKRYPWRIAPYLNFAREGLIVDTALYNEYRNLRDGKNDTDSFQRGIAESPSFGLNTTYVGGDSKRGAFYPPGVRRWGQYYVTEVAKVQSADKLVVFATARGPHAIDTIRRVVPGHHRIEGPWHASVAVGGQVPSFSRWNAPNVPFRPSESPGTYGNLDFRHSSKCIGLTFDGHGELYDLEQLKDMRRWSNQANAPDWHPR